MKMMHTLALKQQYPETTLVFDTSLRTGSVVCLLPPAKIFSCTRTQNKGHTTVHKSLHAQELEIARLQGELSSRRQAESKGMEERLEALAKQLDETNRKLVVLFYL